jgi:lipopolysaccharide/colanic/teichoic acid biosynthesis glycosyltransferase
VVLSVALYPRLKPAIDVLAALAALALLLPVLAAVALLVRLELGRPVLFRQRRPGLGGRPFLVYKFRSMTDARDEDGRLLPDAQRLTRFGRLLRSTSLDELPELANVLKGEMSLVGPRPLRMRYLPRYTREQARRHEVRPGITGWAQVNGRNGISWERKLALDVWYVDHLSLWLDLRILGLTLLTLARREGISAEGHATTPEFRGALDSRAGGSLP